MRRFTTGLLALVGFLMGVAVQASHWSPCFAGATYPFHLFQGYSWRANNLPNTPRPYQTAVRQKANKWKSQTCVTSVEATSGQLSDVIYRAQYYGQTGWFGTFSGAFDNADPCHYVGAEIRLNRTHLEMWPARETYDTACHETGHGFGLGERNSTVSCMGSGSDPDAHDISSVNGFYQLHGDGCF